MPNQYNQYNNPKQVNENYNQPEEKYSQPPQNKNMILKSSKAIDNPPKENNQVFSLEDRMKQYQQKMYLNKDKNLLNLQK